MIQTIPKAKMHWIERTAIFAGFALAALGVGVIASHLTGSGAPLAAAATAAGTVAALAASLWPGERLTYRMEVDRLAAGRLTLPYAEMTGVRLVKLGGTVLYGGLALPGCWSGRAWSPRLGRFWLEGSTGLGQAVLITMASGRRIAVTPDDPVRVVALLESLRRTALPADLPPETAGPRRRGSVVSLPVRRPMS
ncbi:MAG TPA: hypothetical protein VGK74_05655 [Symbiobacteriaceae bacterium]